MHSPSNEVSHEIAPPRPPLNPDWDEAFLRVESYLRAHQLESRMQLNEVVTDIIREARESLAHDGTGAPVATAMRVTHKRIGEWLARAGGEGDWASDVRVRQRGRLSLVLGNVPGQWAGYFLSKDAVPPDLAADLAAGTLRPGPELKLTNMPPAPLEFGSSNPQGTISGRKKAWASVRDAGMWLLVMGFFGVAWAASH